MNKILVLHCLVMGFSWPVFSQTSSNVLLVVNQNSQDSRSIARYYAEKRAIPEQNICRIRTLEQETVTRKIFHEEILEPVSVCLSTRNLQDEVLYIVTTTGVPLIVVGSDSPTGDLASVDSELTMTYSYLTYGGFKKYGRIENPYFAPHYKAGDFRPFLRAKYEIYLVTRLTGATLIDAILLIDRALSTRNDGLFCFDFPSQQRSVEAEWSRQAASQLSDSGVNVKLEESGRILEELSSVQGYCSWGNDDRGFVTQFPRLDWNPGALATTFEKFSAKTFLSPSKIQHPETTDQVPTASTAQSFIAQGLTGFGGFVADPTLDGYFRPQILFPSYISGHNLAESYYLSTRYLSWRQLIVGDPLASPYANKSESRRQELAEQFHSTVDAENGLPRHYSNRRKNYLLHKHLTGEEAVRSYLKAEGLVALGSFSEARRFLTDSLLQDPNLVDSHLLMAEILEAKQEFDTALDHYIKATELGELPNQVYLRICRIALDRLRSPLKAEAAADRLYSRFGIRDLKIAQLWAEVKLELGKTEEAKTVYRQLTREHDPPPFFALAGLGYIYSQQNSWELAREFITRALEQVPENPGNSEETRRRRYEDPGALSALLQQMETKLSGASSRTDVFEAENDGKDAPKSVRPTRVVSRVSPKYPARARQRGIEGRVILSLLIDEMGQLMKSKVVTGHRLLVKAALEAVETWYFEPRLVGRRPEPSRLTVAFNFELKDPKQK